MGCLHWQKLCKNYYKMWHCIFGVFYFLEMLRCVEMQFAVWNDGLTSPKALFCNWKKHSIVQMFFLLKKIFKLIDWDGIVLNLKRIVLMVFWQEMKNYGLSQWGSIVLNLKKTLNCCTVHWTRNQMYCSKFHKIYFSLNIKIIEIFIFYIFVVLKLLCLMTI